MIDASHRYAIDCPACGMAAGLAFEIVGDFELGGISAELESQWCICALTPEMLAAAQAAALEEYADDGAPNV